MERPPLFTGDAHHEPYWWDAAPREPEGAAVPPAESETVIVGAGFTGLSAALTLARAGREVTVLEAGPPGFGASSRNGGMIGSGHRLGYHALVGRFGKERANGIFAEGLKALAFTTGLIEREGIDCHFRRCGRFRGAWTPAAYDAMAREVELLGREIGLEAEVVPQAEQHRETAAEGYRGGVLYPQHGGLHPGLFHTGLLERARAAGVRVIGHCPVLGYRREEAGLRVETERGPVRAGRLIVATNGYTGPDSPALRRRLVPVPSFIIATERLGTNRVKSLMPGLRMYVESRAAHLYYRPSPDEERILMGGRAALHPIDLEKAAGWLHGHLAGLFPELRETRVSHVWTGFVAMTRPGFPAIGERDGVHYACGYNGSGVAMAPYLGSRIALQVLGEDEGRTAFDGLPFPGIPFYEGRPWFLPALSLWHRIKDWRESKG